MRIGPPYILYDSVDIFDSELFKSLYCRIGSNSLKLRLRKNKFISRIVQTSHKKKIYVPNKNMRVVYHGYDHLVFFEFGKTIHEIWRVFFYTGGRFIEKKFLGYPIFYSFNEGEIKNKEALLKFLEERWNKLKKDKIPLHGDFIAHNVLINGGKISLIDSRKITNSKIFDHFNFYSYFVQQLNAWKGISSAKKKALKNSIDDIYANIFGKEDQEYLINLINQIKLSDATGLRNKSGSKNDFVKLIHLLTK